MKNRAFIFVLIGAIILSLAVTNGILQLTNMARQSLQTQSIAAQNIGSNITAEGAIHSLQEASLHFQTGGKLTYLPFKQGDTISSGQTIAQLDTYALQRQLAQVLNSYRSARDTFDQTQQNAQNGNLLSTQRTALNIAGADAGGTSYLNDVVKKIVDQNQANLDNSVINVELANYALQLGTLTAPFSGILTGEDVTVAGQNVTAVTSFSLADPTQLVFRANVTTSDIDYVSLDAPVTVKINGYGKSLAIAATVVKIYPQKITLPTGEDVYQVDVQSPSLQSIARLGQAGNVLIASNARQDSVIVPTWTILAHNQIWVEENGKPILKTVTIGKTHGKLTEILGGLLPTDKVIINASSIASQKYSLL